ncbi:MAG TPA: TIM barrel protein, partial [Pirellulales bacterium]
SASSVLLSGFSDEASVNKTAVQQFAAFAALGLHYFSLRFIDVGQGVKNVMKLSDEEIALVKAQAADNGLKVATLGSPLGKVKLIDQADGTSNRYVPFDFYLADEVQRACDLANTFDTKLIRGFSFYHPKGDDPNKYVTQAVDYLGRMADLCHRNGVVYGVEIEANLIGQTGQICAEIHRQVASPALVTIFDGANILCQGYSEAETYEQYLAMKPGLGWVHIKDYAPPSRTETHKGHVDEEALKHFVPVEEGGSGHRAILVDLKTILPELNAKMKALGAPGVFLDLEPHLKGGGQFGGFSGPDGFGVACRSLCRLLDEAKIGYHIRGFEDVKAARGF